MTMAEERPPDPLFAGAPPDDDLDYYLDQLAEEIEEETFTIPEQAPPLDDAPGNVVDLGLVRNAKTAEDRQADRDNLVRRFASDYFAKVDGRTQLLVRTLAEAIMDLGPLAVGIDDRMWSYIDGVWKPNKAVVRSRTTELLQERYQASSASNAEHIVRAELEEVGRVINGSPVPEIINFRNGHLHWATGVLRGHDPEVLSTIQLGTEWDPSATCPEFDRFLADVLPPDMIEMAWELIGYLMFSGNPLQKAVMFHGTGRNGKGVFVRVIKTLLGEENISGASLQSLAEDKFAPSVLFGKLANICGDIDGAYMEKTAKFKEITGEDHMDAEFKGRDRFQFTNWAVPLFSANRIPGSADVTTGYMARWVVIPFPNNFTGREDRTLTDRISTAKEIRGIAAKAVPALRNLMKRGNFEEPASAKAAMDDFRRKVDQVRTWLEEQAEVGESHSATNRTTIYNDYKDWAKDGGYGQLRSTEFYERLSSIGEELRSAGAGDVLKPKKIDGNRTYSGIKLSATTVAPGWRGTSNY